MNSLLASCSLRNLVKKDPHQREYKDLAITPIIEEDSESLTLTKQSPWRLQLASIKLSADRGSFRRCRRPKVSRRPPDLDPQPQPSPQIPFPDRRRLTSF